MRLIKFEHEKFTRKHVPKGLIVNRLFDMGKRFVMKNGRTSSPPLRLEWLGS